MLALGLGLGLPFGGKASASAPASTAFIIGALTPDGMGDAGTGITTITSGNGSGHFKVAGGAIVGSAAGVAAGYNAGPYTLVTNNGTFVFTRVANAYSIGKLTDFNAPANAGVGQFMNVTAGILNGKRIIGRPGLTMDFGIDDSFGSPLRNTNFGDVGTAWAGVTLESEDYTRPWTSTTRIYTTSRYVQYKGLKVPIPNTGKPNTAPAILLQGSSLPVSDIIIDSCIFYGDVKDPNADWSLDDGTAWANGRAVTDDGGAVSNIRIIGCDIRYAYRAIVIPCRDPVDASAGNLVTQPLHIAGNYIGIFYEHGMNVSLTASNSTATIEDNVIDTVVGLASDNGGAPNGPHPDYFFSNGINATGDVQLNYHRNFHFKNGRGQGGVNPRNIDTPGFHYKFMAKGNVFDVGSGEGCINVPNAASCDVQYNICLASTIVDAGTIHAWLNIGTGSGSTSTGTHTITGNITDVLSVGAGGSLTNNTEMGENEVTHAFTDVFVGLTRPQTRAAALTALVTKGAFATQGAFGSSSPCVYPAANPSNVLGHN